ncbi:MAG: nitrile hydratase subunit beta [Alphaproteobacteria bacterium]|nr:nitrile hydratase subunit beta [Alphaproteobacteria bacterium]MBL6953222.1 nitrile hydratase subunit beta [Alphaproteobacteria bacterium]
MRKLLGVPDLNMPARQGGRAQPGDAHGPVFHQPWQAHAFAIVMTLYENGHYTWPDWDDYLGHEIQSPDHFAGAAPAEIEPPDGDRANYNKFLAACEADGENYYHYWLAGLEKMLDVKGMVSAEALAGRIAAIAKVEAAGPRFKAGDRARVLDIELLGHSHLPNYIRGVIGTVESDRGVKVFPASHGDDHSDDHGHDHDGDKTDALQHVYTMRFQATDIWGAEADPRQSLNFSLWDYQLAPG